MMWPCLIDLGISRENVTIAAQLQVQGWLWAEVWSVLLNIASWTEPKSWVLLREAVKGRSVPTGMDHEFHRCYRTRKGGTVTSEFYFHCLQPSLDRKPKSGCSNSCTKHKVKSWPLSTCKSSCSSRTWPSGSSMEERNYPWVRAQDWMITQSTPLGSQG